MSAFRILVVFLCFLVSCSPNSLEDYQCEGELYCRNLVKELCQIDNYEQLLRAEPILKKHFENLVDLMIKAREYQERHLEEHMGESVVSDLQSSYQLEEELRRIYTIEGGREIIEKTQHEALVRLDAFERNCTRKRQALH